MAKRIGTCNVFPRVWSAIFGCEGRGRFIRWERVTSFTHMAEYGCPTCLAVRSASDALSIPQYAAWLRGWQDLAGVENYRYVHTGRETTGPKRPTLMSHGAPLASALTRWPALTPYVSADEW